MKKLILIGAVLFAGTAIAADSIDDLDTIAAHEYIKIHDRDNDGSVSIDEFQDWEKVRNNAPQLEQGARKGFVESDLNKDGYLSLFEIKADLIRRRALIPKFNR